MYYIIIYTLYIQSCDALIAFKFFKIPLYTECFCTIVRLIMTITVAVFARLSVLSVNCRLLQIHVYMYALLVISSKDKKYTKYLK